MKRRPLWMEFISEGQCGLCGNSGTIDTRKTAFSATGEPLGRKWLCICPNGRAARQTLRHGARTDEKLAAKLREFGNDQYPRGSS